MPIALGIETSCDDTSVSLVTDQAEVLFLQNQNQDDTHKKYGGIVPELASRNHGYYLLPLIEQALKKVPKEKIDVIGVTNRPGLLGSLLVGCVTAKTLSMVWQRALVGVNHIESHILSSYLWDSKSLSSRRPLKFPALSLIVSGGHTSLFYVRGVGDSLLLGSTLDDAAGEALDKFAKLLNFPWPGGPHIDLHSQKIKTNKPHDQEFLNSFNSFFSQIDTKELSFSFSGIKSAGHRFLCAHPKEWQMKYLPEICWSYQKLIVQHLMDKLKIAHKKYPTECILIGGGVSANSFLRSELKTWAESSGTTCFYPEKIYCTDNAAMVGFTALQYFKKGQVSSLDLKSYPRGLDQDFFQRVK